MGERAGRGVRSNEECGKNSLFVPGYGVEVHRHRHGTNEIYRPPLLHYGHPASPPLLVSRGVGVLRLHLIAAGWLAGVDQHYTTITVWGMDCVVGGQMIA